MTTPTAHADGARTRVISPLVGALVFLVCYLAVDPISGLVSRGSLPLPGAPASEVLEYYSANGAASILLGVLQLASVTGLAIVVAGPATRVGGAADATLRMLARTFGWIAVAGMVVSATLAIVLGLVAATSDADTVVAMRTASFLAGGVLHVVALGAFVFTLSRLHGWTRPVRVMAWIAAVPSVLSIASLFWFYASVALPVGRVLSMVALVVAGVSLARGRTPVPAAPAAPAVPAGPAVDAPR